MIKTIVFISSLCIFQAQAMMDPDDEGTSSSTSTTRQQPRSGEDVPPAAPSRDLKHNPQQDDTSTSPQDESKALRDQNAALREQNSDLEARLATLEARLDSVQIGAPRNVHNLTDRHLRDLQQLNSAPQEDDTVEANGNVSAPHLKALQQLNSAPQGHFVTTRDGKVYQILPSTNCKM